MHPYFAPPMVGVCPASLNFPVCESELLLLTTDKLFPFFAGHSSAGSLKCKQPTMRMHVPLYRCACTHPPWWMSSVCVYSSVVTVLDTNGPSCYKLVYKCTRALFPVHSRCSGKEVARCAHCYSSHHLGTGDFRHPHDICGPDAGPPAAARHVELGDRGVDRCRKRLCRATRDSLTPGHEAHRR